MNSLTVCSVRRHWVETSPVGRNVADIVYLYPPTLTKGLKQPIDVHIKFIFKGRLLLNTRRCIIKMNVRDYKLLTSNGR